MILLNPVENIVAKGEIAQNVFQRCLLQMCQMHLQLGKGGSIIIPPGKQSLGGYIGITLSVRLSVCLDATT